MDRHPNSTQLGTRSGELLRASALAAAAKAYKQGRSALPSAADSGLVAELFAGAIRAITSDDVEERHIAAAGLVDLVMSGDLTAENAVGLLSNNDSWIRGQAVRVIPVGPEIAASLLQDPSPNVRAQLADRRTELPAEVLDQLRNETHPEVMRRASAVDSITVTDTEGPEGTGAL
jgi:hypothetical protein